MRVGLGLDVHALKVGKEVILGGVKIPHSASLDGHSDADVLLHALIDALLGAAGAGDIGEHFPPREEKYRNISSLKLLKETQKIVHHKGFVLNNIDLTIIAEEPKISPYKKQIISRIAESLQLEKDMINLKATTAEGLGFTGRKEGIAAQAIVSLKQEQ